MKLMHTETQTPCAHRVTCTRARTDAHTHTHTHVHRFPCTHPHTHACTPTPTHTPKQIARTLLVYTKCPPPPTPPYRLTLKGKYFKIIITRTASQVPELLCQSTDWINWKFYEVCGHLKWFRLVKSQYTLSQCQYVPPISALKEL